MIQQICNLANLNFPIIARNKDTKCPGQVVTLSRHPQPWSVHFQHVLASAQAFGSQKRENNRKINTQKPGKTAIRRNWERIIYKFKDFQDNFHFSDAFEIKVSCCSRGCVVHGVEGAGMERKSFCRHWRRFFRAKFLEVFTSNLKEEKSNQIWTKFLCTILGVCYFQTFGRRTRTMPETLTRCVLFSVIWPRYTDLARKTWREKALPRKHLVDFR